MTSANIVKSMVVIFFINPKMLLLNPPTLRRRCWEFVLVVCYDLLVITTKKHLHIYNLMILINLKVRSSQSRIMVWIKLLLWNTITLMRKHFNLTRTFNGWLLNLLNSRHFPIDQKFFLVTNFHQYLSTAQYGLIHFKRKAKL